MNGNHGKIVQRAARGKFSTALAAHCVAFALLLASSGPAAAQSSKEPAKKEQAAKPEKGFAKGELKDAGVSKLRIEVTAGDDGKPVDSASVYVRWEVERKLAKDQKIEQNWKTNKDGIVKVPEVPRGKVLIQVIAPRWKTFGQWYEIKEDEEVIKIRLQKPPSWY
ncbi:MAG TPA: hypothetical protein VNL38_00900 [Candidatus Nitrosotenuis sp.]|nr:hypothetical protein [Candidatus Nitrosotenuis sp.]